MIACVEEFTILERPYGIEDYGDGAPLQDHFMPDKFKRGEVKRYQCWAGGCGIGTFATIEEARIKLMASAHGALDQKEREARSDLYDVDEGRQELIKFMRSMSGKDIAVAILTKDMVDDAAPMAKSDDTAPIPERTLATLRLRAYWKSSVSGGGVRQGEIVGYTTVANHPAAIIRENNRLTTIYLGDIVDTQFI